MALISQVGASNCIWSEMGINAPNIRKVLLVFCSPDIYSSLKRGGAKCEWCTGAGVGSNRGKSLIVAASPPTVAVVVSTEPLTKKDLVDYLASGCKPKENWRGANCDASVTLDDSTGNSNKSIKRQAIPSKTLKGFDKIARIIGSYLLRLCSRIGTEHRKFGFEIDSLRPIRYEQIAELLHGIADRFDWEK